MLIWEQMIMPDDHDIDTSADLPSTTRERLAIGWLLDNPDLRRAMLRGTDQSDSEQPASEPMPKRRRPHFRRRRRHPRAG